MRKLLYKEFRLAVHPVMYFFLLLSAMVLIPSYPMHIIFFYTCLGVFMMSTEGRENNDLLFSAQLPVEKKQIVMARMMTVSIFQIAQLVMCALFFPLSGMIVRATGGNPVGVDPNMTLLGSGLVMYALFNFVFFRYHFKNVLKPGVGFILGVITIVVYMMIIEWIIIFNPWARGALDGIARETLGYRVAAFGVGAVVYVVGWIVTYKSAAKRFEKVDL